MTKTLGREYLDRVKEMKCIKLKGTSYSLYVTQNGKILDQSEREEMKKLFLSVMEKLQFFAHEEFLERLYNTSYILRIRSKNGDLAGFGNAEIRNIDGLKILHILSIYISPKHRAKNLMVKCWQTFIGYLIAQRWFCIFNPLYITASAVNPQAMLALARLAPVWPDFINNSPPPSLVHKIAEESAVFYPNKGDKPFQVGITEEYAGIRSGKKRLSSTDKWFDEQFYEYAIPEEMKLILFVSRIGLFDVIKFLSPYRKKNWRKSK